MNEITRVHIASVQYDIEIDAKKILQTYLNKIKTYTTDEDLLEDVEARIAELLSERGIKKDGVITMAAVSAITSQLGEAEAFSEDDRVVPDDAAVAKKLYRDSGSAWIGGIAAGLARYLGTSAWWIRILLFISIPLTSGLTVLIYILLWLIIPATKTQADVLRLNGEAVTVTSLGESNAQNVNVKPLRDRKIARAVSITLGSLILLVAFVSVFGAIFGAVYMATNGININNEFVTQATNESTRTWIYASIITAALTSLVFALLAAYLLISWRFKRAIIITMIVAFALAIISGISIGVAGITARQQAINEVQRNSESRTITLPSLYNLKSVKIANHSDAHVVYMVTIGDKPRIEMSTQKTSANPTYTYDNGQLSINVPESHYATSAYGYFPETITIYGPSLSQLDVTQGSVWIAGNGNTLESLAVTMSPNTLLVSSEMGIRNLSATLGEYASLGMNGTNVTNASITASQYANASFGTVNDLTITAPETCGDLGSTSFNVESITTGSFTLNGTKHADEDYTSSCIQFLFGASVKYED